MKIKGDKYEGWDIYDGEKIVGRIEFIQSLRSSMKVLYVNDKRICQVDNQKDAIKKLEDFFKANKEEIKLLEGHILELKEGMELVRNSAVCVDALSQRLQVVIDKLNKLKSYDII